MRNLRSPNLRKRRRKRLALRTIFILIILLIIISIPVYITRLSRIQVRNVTVLGTNIISPDDITKIVKNDSSGNYLLLFPKMSVILFPRKQIEKNILKQFPRIESVDISLRAFNTAIVSISERKPFATWCDVAEDENCFLLDKTGLVFDKGAKQSSSVYFTYRGFFVEDPVGKTYLANNQFVRLNNFIESIKTLGLEPESLSALSDNQFELVMVDGGKIFFLLDGNEEQTLSNLESVLKDSSLSVIIDGVLNVSAIDLRYGNKVILKK